MEIISPQIRVYNTHIEIFPYKQGDNFDLEKKFCKFDPSTHHYDHISMMCTNYHGEDKLYLPRGANIKYLETEFQTTAIDCTNGRIKPHTRISYSKDNKPVLLGKPRNRIQEEALDFLTGKKNFKNSNLYNQLGLNLDTGDGKTFCTIAAIIKLNLRAIIIVHKKKLKQQWREEFLKMTNLQDSDIIELEGSGEIRQFMNKHEYTDGKIFIVTHQTLHSYASSNEEDGWLAVSKFFDWLHVGIKVIDEAHKYFENSLKLDFFTNTYKTFYLTATFGRSDPKEKRLYKVAYSSVLRYGEETIYYEEKRKHINFVIVYFHSDCGDMSPDVTTMFGFSSYKYIDYEFLRSDGAIFRVIEQILEKTKNLKGKTLVISPKIASVTTVAEKIKDMTDKSVGIVHSKNDEETNEKNREKDIISTTIKSIGEGDNVKGLRIIINTEPVGSENLIDQLRGRLREYSAEDETFFFHLVDTSVPESVGFLKRFMSVMKKKCKSIMVMRLDV